MQTTQFLGLDSVILENSTISLIIPKTIGPRVTSIRLKDGENLFAELEDLVLDCPGTGKFKLYGGHRLWHSPEDPARTYIPDDNPVEIQPLQNGIKLIQQVETKTGIQKTIQIDLPDDSAKVIVTHKLTNEGLWPVECSPWAITQMKTGGFAILPQSTKDTGKLANRVITVWPYTDMNDENIQWGNQYIFVRAQKKSGALKLGFPNPHGWLAYWVKGTLFVKKAAFDPSVDYFDFGSSSQCYCNDQFIELESLGPISKIPPNGSVTHIETWEIFRDVDLSPDENSVKKCIENLGFV